MKKMTTTELKAFDWATLLLKLPVLAQLVSQLISILLKEGGLQATARCECPDEVCDACDEECDAVIAMVVAHVKLHSLIAGETCAPAPEPVPAPK